MQQLIESRHQLNGPQRVIDGAAATLLTRDAARLRLFVDHGGLIQQIRERAQTGTGQPLLLRIYWFDGAPDRVPQPEHRRLRVMPRGTGMAYG